MERIEEHNCIKKGENADIFKRYYTHDKKEHIHYCHYCGEEVTESDYVRNLELQLQDSLSLIDRYEQLQHFIDLMVEEMKKPRSMTETGASSLIRIEHFLQLYLHCKEYPSELQAYMKALNSNP